MTANSNKSFFANLMERRFFQFLGSYLIGVWGIVQFIDWIADRFDYNRSWSETTLAFFVLLVPSAIIIIYNHGKSGSQSWGLLEKILIPANVIVAIFLTLTFYVNRNIDSILENHPERVTIYDEDGNEIQRLVPQTANTRRIVFFPLVNKTNNDSNQWQSIGLPKLLSADLEQDNRLYAIDPFSLNDSYIDYGFDMDKETPFSILRKIADDFYSDFFFTGSYEKNEATYKISIEAFTTLDGKSFFTSIKEGDDFFKLIDEISEEFKTNLSLPDTEKDIPLVDLPSSNLFSSQPEVYKDFINSLSLNEFQNDPKAAISLMEKAIEKDPNCVECYSSLGQQLLRTNQTPQALIALENAMKRIDVLPERQQLNIKYLNYYFHSEVEKTIALTNMWLEFYPNDYKPYQYLINLYLRRSDLEKAKAISKKAIKVGHKGEIFIAMAEIAILQGELREAKSYYDQFQQAYPHRAVETIGLADIYVKESDYDKARTHLERLQVMNSNEESIPLKLANVEFKSGNPTKAIDYLQKALTNTSNVKDSVTTLAQLEGYYNGIGQVNKAIQLKEERMQLQLAFQSPNEIQAEFLMYPVIDQYVKAGKQAEIEKILKPFMENENPSFPSLPCSSRINYYLAVRDLKNATKYEKECRDFAIQAQGATSYLIVDAFMADLKGDYQKAVEAMEKFKIATNVNELYIENFMVRFYRLNNQLDEAKALAIEQIEKNPVAPEMLYELALTYQQEGNNKEAIVNLNKALEIWKEADENFIPAQNAKAKLAEIQADR